MWPYAACVPSVSWWVSGVFPVFGCCGWCFSGPAWTRVCLAVQCLWRLSRTGIAGPRGVSVLSALGKDWTVSRAAAPVCVPTGSRARLLRVLDGPRPLPPLMAAPRGRALARLFHALSSLLNRGFRGGSSPAGWGVERPAACWWVGAHLRLPWFPRPLWEALLPRPEWLQRGRTICPGTCGSLLGKEFGDSKVPSPLLIPWCPHKAGRKRSPSGGTCTHLPGARPGPGVGTAGGCLCGRSFCVSYGAGCDQDLGTWPFP